MHENMLFVYINRIVKASEVLLILLKTPAGAHSVRSLHFVGNFAHAFWFGTDVVSVRPLLHPLLHLH